MEKYKFGVLALQKSVNDVDLQLAYFTRTSSVQFTPDLIGDLMFNGVATNVYRSSVANGIQADGAFRLNEAHTLRAGMFASMEKTTVSSVNRCCQSTARPAQISPDIPFHGDRYQRAARLARRRLHCGRMEAHGPADIEHRDAVRPDVAVHQREPAQPAHRLTYNPFDSTTFHAGFARNFSPPAQVIAAPANTALFTSCPPPLPATCTTVQAPSAPPPYYPMQPERSNIYDIGVVQKVLPGLELGADVYLKMTRNQINQGQFGAALVLNGFNYERGINTGVELKAIYTDGDLRAYANWAWATQRGNNVVTTNISSMRTSSHIPRTIGSMPITPRCGPDRGEYPISGTAPDFRADLIYGSGLRSGFANTDHVPSYAQVNAGHVARIRHSWLEPGHVALRRRQCLRYQLRDQEWDRHRRVRQRVSVLAAATISACRRSSGRAPRSVARALDLPGYKKPFAPPRFSESGFRGPIAGPGPASISAGTSATARAGSAPIRSTATFGGTPLSATHHRSSTTARSAAADRLQLAMRHVAGGYRDRHAVRAPAHSDRHRARERSAIRPSPASMRR